MMAEVVRWFKSGGVKLTKFSPLKIQNDDTEGETEGERRGGSDQEADSNVRVQNKGKNHNSCIVLQ